MAAGAGAAVISETLSVLTGVLVAAAGPGLFVWVYRRRWAAARSRLGQEAGTLEREFPLTVRDWGGPDRLRDPAAVRQALRALEAGQG
jgi:hypothetical protein